MGIDRRSSVGGGGGIDRGGVGGERVGIDRSGVEEGEIGDRMKSGWERERVGIGVG